MKTYEPTAKLKDAKYRGQKALVIKALSQLKGARSLEELTTRVKKNGDYKINRWAEQHGGLEGSVQYHLRGLAALRMVKIVETKETPKAPKDQKEVAA